MTQKFNILTLGCKVNQYETEAMEELFIDRGYHLANEGEIADVYVINTCTVTHLGDRKSRQFISRAKRSNPDAVVAVVGCYSQVDPDVVEAIEGVDVIIGTKNRGMIVDLCERSKQENRQINEVLPFDTDTTFDELEISTQTSRTRSVIKIQEGCNMFCSYCVIPYARGPICSRDYLSIVEEAQRLAEAGFKEVILTGIHVASYGKEGKDDKRLIDVIEGVAKVDGIERIRLSSMEQATITEDFLQRAKATGKLCDHFHLSLQSGSRSVLKRMNRHYSPETYRAKVELIRQHFPNVGLTTDMIVGFPGETEEEFNETVTFVKEIGFSKGHIFKYSKRANTPAAEMPDQVPEPIKKERSAYLQRIFDLMGEDFSQSQVGLVGKVLIEDVQHGALVGYTTNYLRVGVDGDEEWLNRIIDVEIDSATGGELTGRIVRR